VFLTHETGYSLCSFFCAADVVKNTALCVQTLRVTPRELDIFTRTGEPIEKLLTVTMERLLNELSFSHWRELHATSHLVERLKKHFPSRQIHAQTEGVVAAAQLLAQAEREATVQTLEQALKRPLGSGERTDQHTAAYLEELQQSGVAVAKWPDFVRTIWPKV
jgi:ribonuclease HII